VVLSVIALSVFARKAPGYVVSSLEEALDKDISVGDVQYQFPLSFEVGQLSINERGEFKGENSFYAENVSVSLRPYELLKKRIVFDTIVIAEPQLTIRKFRGEMIHAFGQREEHRPVLRREAPRAPEAPRPEARRAPAIAVEVKELRISQGAVKLIDYDIDARGFVIVFHNLNARVRNFTSGTPHAPLSYEMDTLLLQGRNVGPARLSGSGWSRLENLDTEMNMRLEGFWLPYFAPYYQKVTPSRIQDGVVDVQSTTVIRDLDWTTNARVNIRRLLFEQYESDNQILGFDAMSIVEILQDNAGRIALDLIIRWNMKDPNVTFEDALKRSIRHSVKSTFELNIDRVVGKTLEKISQQGPDFLKDDWQNVIKDEKFGGVLDKILQIVE